VDDIKLEALAQPTPPSRTPEKPASEAPVAPPVDLAKANEKLSSLLGGKQ
jgi:hypothetical protein